MTAIAVVYTNSGLVVAADGRSRWDDDSTRDDVARQNESEHDEKVFEAQFGTRDIAWVLTGYAFNKDRSFSLIEEAYKCIRAANATPLPSFESWLELFAARLRDSISEARNNESIEPFTENGDSGEAERSFRREAERHSGMIPNTIGA
jgi:hypothetical protein